MKMLMLISVVLLTSTYVFSNQQIVSNPYAYSEASARSYAEGDFSDDSGFEGCKSLSQGNKLTVKCLGTRKILFHGGEEIKSEFTCFYQFLKIASNKYRIINQICE